MPTINDIKPRAFRSIPIKVYEEIKGTMLFGTYLKPQIAVSEMSDQDGNILYKREVEWCDNNGVNTPYVVTII